jgi:glucose/arabinose dehydrogenase
METTDTVANYHHGGGLAFGPDGKLYWGKGDNTTGANAQDLTNIYGKILRLNPDGSTPSDNPSLPAGALPQIYAYGFRNPFRLSFTPTGELLVADVGNAAFEELDKVTAGGNYGWPGSEGTCTSNCAGQTNPIYTYPHGTGTAISSVLAINSSKVFIADEVQGWMKVLTCNATYTSCGNPQDFDPNAGTTVELLRGPDGAMYQLGYTEGTLVRIPI